MILINMREVFGRYGVMEFGDANEGARCDIRFTRVGMVMRRMRGNWSMIWMISGGSWRNAFGVWRGCRRLILMIGLIRLLMS